MTMQENDPEQLLELLDSIADDLEDVVDFRAEEQVVVSDDESPPEAVRPVAFAGLSATRRNHPDPPPRIEPSPRARGTAAQVLSAFKWV
jgi:hypothetical protein